MVICINPYCCPYKNCKLLHHQKRKFYKTLHICEKYSICSDYNNCTKFHPTRCQKVNDLYLEKEELLPKDIIENIILYLEWTDINHLHRTSKQFDFIFDRIKNPLKIQYLRNIKKNYCKKINIKKYELNDSSIRLYSDDNIFIFKNLYGYYETFIWDSDPSIPKELNSNTIFIGNKDIKIYHPRLYERVDAMDNEGVWYEAKIIEITEQYYIVHFLSWSNKWDIKIPKNSYAIAKLYTFTPNWRKNIKINDLIDVKVKGLWYMGNIINKSKNYIWIQVKTIKNTSTPQIFKKLISDDTIAMHRTHTGLHNNPDYQSIYRFKYFASAIMHERLNKGLVSLYMKKKHDKYWELVNKN